MIVLARHGTLETGKSNICHLTMIVLARHGALETGKSSIYLLTMIVLARHGTLETGKSPEHQVEHAEGKNNDSLAGDAGDEDKGHEN